MLKISAVDINKKAPYQVVESGENSFSFTTQYGLVYNVGFCVDQSFLEEGVYQFYILNLDDSHFHQDDKVKDTIQAVIEVFFEMEPAVMLYICDIKDNRQAGRDRLFRLWFLEYANSANFTMVNENVTFDETTYYASILLRNDHPDYISIIQLFKDFVSDLPGKFN